MPYNTVIGIDVGKDSDQAQLWARGDGELGSWGREGKLLYSFQLRVIEGEHFPWGKLDFGKVWNQTYMVLVFRYYIITYNTYNK